MFLNCVESYYHTAKKKKAVLIPAKEECTQYNDSNGKLVRAQQPFLLWGSTAGYSSYDCRSDSENQALNDGLFVSIWPFLFN